MFKQLHNFILISILLAFSAIASASGIKAVVNDDIITDIEYKQRINLALLTTGGRAGADKNFKETLLDNLIAEKIRLQAAKKSKISFNEAEVEAAIEGIEKGNKMPAGTLTKIFQSKGIPISVFKDQIRAQLIWRNYVRAVLMSHVNVNEFEVEEILQEELSKGDIDQYKIYEIYVPVPVQSADSIIKGRLDSARTRILQGASFSEVARQISHAPSRTEGGSVGWVIPSQLGEPLNNVVKGMKIGQISKPTRNIKGYTMIKLVDKRKASMKNESDLDGIREQIRAKVRSDLIKELADSHYEELKSASYIEIN